MSSCDSPPSHQHWAVRSSRSTVWCRTAASASGTRRQRTSSSCRPGSRRVRRVAWKASCGTAATARCSRWERSTKEPPCLFVSIGDAQSRSVIVSPGPLPPPEAEVARRDAEPQRQAAGRPRRPDGSVHRRRRQGLVHTPLQTERTAVQPTEGRPVGLMKGLDLLDSQRASAVKQFLPDSHFSKRN